MPKTWNQFVTEYAITHQLSRKEAMNKAAPAWAKYKRSRPTHNTVKGLKKRDDVIDWPPQKPKKKKSGSTIKQTTIHRSNHRGGRIISPNLTELIRRQHYPKRKRKRQTIYQDSAYNSLAQLTGVHRL